MDFHNVVLSNALASPYLFFRLDTSVGNVVYCQATSYDDNENVRIYWGDGAFTDIPSKSLEQMQHTYAEAGQYMLAIECHGNGLSRIKFDNTTANIIASNESWSYHPGMTKLYFGYNAKSLLSFTSIPSVATDLNFAFYDSPEALLPIKKLPDGITTMQGAFRMDANALLPFEELPASLTGDGGINAFSGCSKAVSKITRIPEGCTDISGMFYRCSLMDIRIDRLPANVTSIKQTFDKSAAKINLDELAANAPDGGYQALADIHGAFYENMNVTGSRSRFLSVCPNVQDTEWAFAGTSTVE